MKPCDISPPHFGHVAGSSLITRFLALASFTEADQRSIIPLGTDHETAFADGWGRGNPSAGDLVLFDQRTVGELGFVQETVLRANKHSVADNDR